MTEERVTYDAATEKLAQARVTLTAAQARAVLALVRERAEIVAAANRQVEEIGAALAELAQVYQARLGLPGPAHFEDAPGGGVQMVLDVQEAKRDDS